MLWRPSDLECWIVNQKKEVELYVKRPLDSLVRQLVDITRAQYWQNNDNVKDTGGTNRADSYRNYFKASSPSGNSDYGIVVGTGTNAVTVSDYALQTKIVTGSGAGQLSYQAQVVNSPVLAGSTVSFTLQRTFNNTSGGDITIQEVGLIVYGVPYTWYFLIARDLTGGHLVQTAKSYVAQYTFGVTV